MEGVHAYVMSSSTAINHCPYRKPPALADDDMCNVFFAVQRKRRKRHGYGRICGATAMHAWLSYKGSSYATPTFTLARLFPSTYCTTHTEASGFREAKPRLVGAQIRADRIFVALGTDTRFSSVRSRPDKSLGPSRFLIHGGHSTTTGILLAFFAFAS